MVDYSNQAKRIDQVEQMLITAMNKYQVPGVNIAVIHDYSVVWSRAYGVLQADQAAVTHTDTLFQACSISKAVTAVAILRLVQTGLLDLDVDVNHYLTTWKIPGNETWQPIVTLRQILSHTAGINVPWFYGYHRDQDIPSLSQILEGEKPANTPSIRVNLLPGTRFRYSGGGYCVLQQLLCDLRHQSFPDLMHDLVFAPVGMKHSTYEQPLPKKYWDNASSGHRVGRKPLAGRWHTMPEMAAAGLWTTSIDLARFSIDLQLALSGQLQQLLSPEMVTILISPEVQRDAGFMGLGVWLDGSGTTGRIGHPGDNEGFACRWMATRENGMGVVIMTNSDTGGELIDEVIGAVEQAFEWPKIKDGPPAKPFTNASIMEYIGTYQFRLGMVCTILHMNNQLYVQMLDQPPIPLSPVSETVYLLEALDGEITFLLNKGRKVSGLRLQQDGSELEAEKIS